MKNEQLKVFRLYFVLGGTIAFVSLFLDWYLFQGVDSTGTLLIDWNYQLFFDWYSPSNISTELNNWYKPINASIPIPLVLFFIGLLMISAFGALRYNPEKFIQSNHSKGLGFINIAMILMLMFFIVIYPIIYLFPNKLLFPSLIVYDNEVGLAYNFTMGLGYWLQIVAFACCFPYACLYYKIANTFELEYQRKASPSSNTSVDLDKLIAEAEFMIHQQQKESELLSKNVKPYLSEELVQKQTPGQEIFQKFMKTVQRRDQKT